MCVNFFWLELTIINTTWLKNKGSYNLLLPLFNLIGFCCLIRIGHFRVVLYLFFKASLLSIAFHMKMSFHSHADKTYFHMKRFARSLALKKRHKTIRKWPISRSLFKLMRFRRSFIKSQTSKVLIDFRCRSTIPNFMLSLSAILCFLILKFLLGAMTTGLAFSGGGIRSAAFCSGVLRRLLERNVEVDYLSCVSGGGYTGTAYLDWKYREEKKARPEGDEGEDHRAWHDTFFRHMRERAGYLCHWEKPLQGILDTMILSLILLVNFIEPIMIWGSYACPTAFIIDLLFGKYLREKQNCDDVPATKSGQQRNASLPDHNATMQRIRRCLTRQGTANFYTVMLFSVLFALFVIFFILARKSPRKRYSTALSFMHTTFAVLLALTFLPFAIHDFLVKIPPWTQYLIVFLGVMIWFFLPLLRTKTSYVLIIYLYSYVIYWKVYEADMVHIPFSDEVFHRLLFVSGFALWVVPLVTASHVRLIHVYNR